MDVDVKNYIMGMMTTGGHRHELMSDTLKCVYCGERMKKAEAEYKRLRKEYPKKFIRKQPEIPNSPETNQKLGLLAERLKKDKLYQRHIKLLGLGTPEERKREIARADKGYYTRHYEEDGNIKTKW